MKLRSNTKEPLYTTPLPDGPWIPVRADLFEFEGQDYIVLTDYYSRWLEILHLRRSAGSKDTTATAVISKLKDVFARFGVPFELVSDNGPQFTSDAFAQFALCYGFSRITSDPYLPQANGAAERSVQTAKAVLATSDPWLSMRMRQRHGAVFWVSLKFWKLPRTHEAVSNNIHTCLCVKGSGSLGHSETGIFCWTCRYFAIYLSPAAHSIRDLSIPASPPSRDRILRHQAVTRHNAFLHAAVILVLIFRVHMWSVRLDTSF